MSNQFIGWLGIAFFAFTIVASILTIVRNPYLGLWALGAIGVAIFSVLMVAIMAAFSSLVTALGVQAKWLPWSVEDVAAMVGLVLCLAGGLFVLRKIAPERPWPRHRHVPK